MNWTESKLKELGIFEIRSVARSVGVKSPTVLKKETVINEIMKITRGEAQPYKRPNNKGRPPLEIGSIKSFVDVFAPMPQSAFNNADVFLSELKVSSGNTFGSPDGEVTKTRGILEVAPQGYGFVYEEGSGIRNIFISEPMVVKNALMNGDEVEVSCKNISDDGKRAVFEVARVNNLSVNDAIEEKQKCKMQNAQVKPKIDSLMNGINKGDRIAIVGSKDESRKKIIDLFEKCSGDKLLINANIAEEEFAQQKNVVNIGMLEERRAAGRRIENLFALEQNRASRGSNIALFITDIIYLTRALAETNIVTEAVEADALLKVKRLFASGKKYGSGGSLTVVAGFNKNALAANIVTTELCEIADKTM